MDFHEEERHHIALELHDEIGQALTGLKLSLEMTRSIPANQSQQGIRQAQSLASELLGRVREMSLDLRPAMLDDLGLLPALLWHFERYTAQTGVRVNFSHGGLERRFAPEVETAAYRIVQEALTNVARHARVREVTVHLAVDAGRLGVQIEDYGIGFDPQIALAANVSNGLAGMHERARLLGGRLQMQSTPGVGTLLSAELPLDATKQPRRHEHDDYPAGG